MSKPFNDFDFNLERKSSGSFTNSFNYESKNIEINSSKNEQSFLDGMKLENKNLRSRAVFLIEQNKVINTEKSDLILINKKNEERINELLKENIKLKADTEHYEQLKIRINIYEKIDFLSFMNNSSNVNQEISGFLEKIRVIESDYGKEIISLKNIISQLKLQLEYFNNNELTTQSNNLKEILSKKEYEIGELKKRLAKAEITNDLKTNEINRINKSIEEQKEQMSKLMNENNFWKAERSSFQIQTTLNNSFSDKDISVSNSIHYINMSNSKNNNNNDNYCHNEFIKPEIYEDIKCRFSQLEKDNEALKEELESEKNKYISLLHMNQDLATKLIENTKIINENKSEIAYLKKKVSECQKEKGENFSSEGNNSFGSNLELPKRDELEKFNEIKQNLEKKNQEYKTQINELIEQVKTTDQKLENLKGELKLEKMENENLKEIQKTDLKNISKILSEQMNPIQIRKNEELISELKISLQNTNKINQELTNQKSNLEKEIVELRNKLKEHQNSTLSNYNSENPNYPSFYKDDKSQAAFSKYSMASNSTHTKFFDNKIKDLEDSLIQEKDNSNKLLNIKQGIIDKLKKSNEQLLAERNKLSRELSEEKMKINGLQMDKKALMESEEYLKSQNDEMNEELCELKLNKENNEFIEEKLEELQKQYINLVNSYNNPQIQQEHYQKLVNDNVELNVYKSKYLNTESELQEKIKELSELKDKAFYLERDFKALKNNQIISKNDEINKNSENTKNLIEEYDRKIKALEQENNELKKNIEENKLIVLSLREKCKDVITKEKEILRLNSLITELNQRKKKRVSFGKEILVEFKKDDSPTFNRDEVKTQENVVKEPKPPANYLSDLLKNQESLLEKYQNELLNLKKIQPTAMTVDIKDVGKIHNSNIQKNIDSNLYNNNEQINLIKNNDPLCYYDNNFYNKYLNNNSQFSLNSNSKNEKEIIQNSNSDLSLNIPIKQTQIIIKLKMIFINNHQLVNK